jgi:hypothetical protein
MKLDVRVVGCTIGSMDEVPGERKPVIKDVDDDDDDTLSTSRAHQS